jgi:hypothetical protein
MFLDQISSWKQIIKSYIKNKSEKKIFEIIKHQKKKIYISQKKEKKLNNF